MKRISFLLALFVMMSTVHCQENKELAQEKKRRAVELMDNGLTDEALELLVDAKKLDPGNYEYDYEIGFAYYLNHDMQATIKVFKKVIVLSDAGKPL